MDNDFRSEHVTPETEKLLLAGRAKARKIWKRIRDDVSKLDEYGALVCMNDLVIMHIGYSDGRWPGFAHDLIPVVMEILEDSDAPDRSGD